MMKALPAHVERVDESVKLGGHSLDTSPRQTGGRTPMDKMELVIYTRK